MKKLALLAIFGVLSSFASAAVPGNTATANVNITIAKYVAFTSSTLSALTINVNDGGQSPSYDSGTASFSILANTPYTVTVSTTTAPSVGTLTGSIVTGDSGVAPGGSGTVKATLTGISLSTGPTTTSGVITLTVTADN